MRKGGLTGCAVHCAVLLIVAMPSAAKKPRSASGYRLTAALVDVDFDLQRRKHVAHEVQQSPRRNYRVDRSSDDISTDYDQEQRAPGLSVKPALGRYRLPATRFRGPSEETVFGVGAKLPLEN